MIINKGNTTPIFPGANFTQDEVYKASFGTNGEPFTISDDTLKGIQIIRSYYGIPFIVSASYRTPAHEKAKDRTGTGTHARGLALDIDPIGKTANSALLDYHQQIINKGPLYQQLRAVGINGFGLYDGFIHIDSRSGGNQSDAQNGSYAFWDNRITTKKKRQA